VADKYRNTPGWEVRELACGHEMPIDMPDELASLLIGAA